MRILGGTEIMYLCQKCSLLKVGEGFTVEDSYPDTLLSAIIDFAREVAEQISDPGSTQEPLQETMFRSQMRGHFDDVIGRVERFMSNLDDQMSIEEDEEEENRESVKEAWEDEARQAVDTLVDLLNEVAPPYCSFILKDEHYRTECRFVLDRDSLDEAIHDGSLIKLDACEEFPEDEVRERLAEGLEVSGILYVNDHGNVTLMGFHENADGSFEEFEIWSVV